MKIKFNVAAIRRTRWYEFLIRFAFGGAMTAMTGLVAKHYGPEIGGLFLAYPAILPATAVLIEKHEQQKKYRHGKEGTIRARAIAGVDAAGAAMGSLGLLAFAAVVWRWITIYPLIVTMCIATLAWFFASVLTWEVHETLWRSIRARLFDGSNARAAKKREAR